MLPNCTKSILWMKNVVVEIHIRIVSKHFPMNQDSGEQSISPFVEKKSLRNTMHEELVNGKEKQYVIIPFFYMPCVSVLFLIIMAYGHLIL